MYPLSSPISSAFSHILSTFRRYVVFHKCPRCPLYNAIALCVSRKCVTNLNFLIPFLTCFVFCSLWVFLNKFSLWLFIWTITLFSYLWSRLWVTSKYCDCMIWNAHDQWNFDSGYVPCHCLTHAVSMDIFWLLWTHRRFETFLYCIYRLTAPVYFFPFQWVCIS